MKSITISVSVEAPIQKVWDFWTQPKHITQWNFASPEWQCPNALNELKPEGKFSWRMEAKDGSMGFDYEGKYKKIKNLESINKELGDGRKVEIQFREKDGNVEVVETFEPDLQASEDMQRQGWQAILENFKSYVEAN